MTFVCVEERKKEVGVFPFCAEKSGIFICCCGRNFVVILCWGGMDTPQ